MAQRRVPARVHPGRLRFREAAHPPAPDPLTAGDLDELADLAGDTRRGAAEIARGLLDWCEAWGADEPPDDRRPSAAEAAGGLARLARAQTALAPVLRIANDLLLEIERREADDVTSRRAVHTAGDAWRRRLASADEALSLHLRRAFEGATTIYTYSASSTIAASIVAHFEAGQWFTVAVSESRPGGEGTALACSLAGRGVRVTLGTEAWLWGALEEGGVLVVGADALLSTAWVNKIGTAALAARARESGVPVVVGADTSKWLPPALATLPRSYERDPGEIFAGGPPSLEIRNPYFEELPYGALDHLVTERGPTRPRDLRVGEIPVARVLR